MTNPEIPQPEKNNRFSYFDFLGEIQPKRELAQPHTLEKLRLIKEGFEEVAVGQSVVSERPIVSYAFGYCKGLIVRQGKKMGVSHLLQDQDPDDFVIYTKQQLNADGKITAITMVDDNDEKLRKVCAENGIEVVETVMVNGQIRKDIIAIPESGEVLIFSADGQELVKNIP